MAFRNKQLRAKQKRDLAKFCREEGVHHNMVSYLHIIDLRGEKRVFKAKTKLYGMAAR